MAKTAASAAAASAGASARGGGGGGTGDAGGAGPGPEEGVLRGRTTLWCGAPVIGQKADDARARPHAVQASSGADAACICTAVATGPPHTHPPFCPLFPSLRQKDYCRDLMSCMCDLQPMKYRYC
eukprot:Rhum_TRINITY_DN14235_c10_g1::Rhum_TRINITY_DN14235_c10_g1_i1::g.74605::m.74605